MRVHQQPAFVLLNRPFSESSWICEVFSKHHGRIALIAKGARRLKSPFTGVLLPFQPVLLSWSGKGEIPTLTAAEIRVGETNLIDHELIGEALICGFYCNELITYLLHRYDPHQSLFDTYQETLIRLSNSSDQNLPNELRRFERRLIKETGYEVSFEFEAGGKQELKPDSSYQYLAGEGFVACPPNHSNAVPGRAILGLRANSPMPQTPQQNAQGKQIMRAILRQSLGSRSINSRELFVRARESY